MNSTTTAGTPLESQEVVVPFPYDIQFADCDVSPATRYFIEENFARLAHFYDRITYARAIVRIPHKHGGVRLFHIHLQLDVPGRVLVVSREPEADDAHIEIHVAIRDAFAKLTRQLEDFVKARKNHKGQGAGGANGQAI